MLLDPVEAPDPEIVGLEEGLGEADRESAGVEPGAGVGRVHALGRDDLQERQGAETGADVRRPDPGRGEELLQRRPGSVGRQKLGRGVASGDEGDVERTPQRDHLRVHDGRHQKLRAALKNANDARGFAAMQPVEIVVDPGDIRILSR